MTELNTDLFLAIADQIEFYPDSYDQTTWGAKYEGPECGTTCCIAGLAVVLSGHELWRYAEDRQSGDPMYLVANIDGSERGVADAGQRLLGLDYDEAVYLFDLGWNPPEGMTVSEALRHIGKGDLDTKYTEYD